MSDMGDFWREYKDHIKKRKVALGLPCPHCSVKLPKATPKILMPHQKCWCGYVDNRQRGTGETK